MPESCPAWAYPETGFETISLHLVAPVVHLACPHLFIELAIQLVLVGLIHACAHDGKALLGTTDLSLIWAVTLRKLSLT